MHYEKLFEKGTIGRLELRNRVVMTAMGTMLGDWNGCSTPEQVRFYEERAKGGCGLIIPEFTSVDPDSGHCNRIQLGIWDERQIASFERICDAVHRHGAKIFVQLHHGGREAPPAINGGRQAMAPSVELNSVVGRATILPREMTIEDIDRLVGLFIQAALNAQAAGADGVEIHGAHGYLLQQFLSPYTNKRTDEYGGSMENRCRFIVRILKGIREVVEPGFVVGARINGNDFVEGGNDQDACVEIAKYLEPYVDYFNVSCGVYASAATMIEPCYSPEGWRSGFVKAIKSHVSVPVIAVNTVKHPQFAEQLLQEGVSDFVGMSRMHIADPYLVQKAMAGREDLIRKCLGCMNCNKSVVAGRTLHCALNPIAGHEVTFGDDKLVKNGNGRKVAIVGGGPAGLAAAYSAWQHGLRDILILERDNELGGILNQCIHNGFGLHRFGEQLTGPEYAGRYIEMLRSTGVRVELGTMVLEVTPDKKIHCVSKEKGYQILEAKSVILCMGCRERTRGAIGIPGTRPAGIYTAGAAQRYVNMEGYLVGKRVLILGSGDIGLIMARRLTLEGAEVLGVYEAKSTPSGLTRNIHQCLHDYNIPLHLSHTVTRVFGADRLTGVEVAEVDAHMRPIAGTEQRIDCDALIVSVGLIPENELAESLGVPLDGHTRGPVCDGQLMTEIPGIFSCGNALHVNDLVDYVSASGELAGKSAAHFAAHTRDEVALTISDGFGYLVPQRLDRTQDNSAVTLYFRSAAVLGPCRVVLTIDGKETWSRRYPFLRPPEMQQLTLDFDKLGIAHARDVHFTIEVAEA